MCALLGLAWRRAHEKSPQAQGLRALGGANGALGAVPAINGWPAGARRGAQSR